MAILDKKFNERCIQNVTQLPTNLPIAAYKSMQLPEHMRIGLLLAFPVDPCWDPCWHYFSSKIHFESHQKHADNLTE